MVAMLSGLVLGGCGISANPLAGFARAALPTAAPTAAVTSAFDAAPSTSSSDTVIDRALPSSGCKHIAPVSPGASADETMAVEPAVANGAHTRSFRVHVPVSYDDGIPEALVLVFHGTSNSTAGIEESTGFSQVAEQENFIAVYPQGLLDGNGQSFWANAGPKDEGIDDVLFVSNLLTELQRQFCVDPQRIFATGFSNGGGMTGLLACRLASRIAAFAAASGNFYAAPSGCHPSRPVPILEVHGAVDTVVPYAGVQSGADPDGPLPAVSAWLQDWAVRDGCGPNPISFRPGAGITGEQWVGCRGDGTVLHYRMDSGGHEWPQRIGQLSGTVAIWHFLEAYSLPRA
jgi:polyhydroxybutyrate depolymerase